MRVVYYIFIAVLAGDVAAQELESQTITTKPTFADTVRGERDLVLREGDYEWSFLWESQEHGVRAPVELDPAKLYTFTFVSSRLQGPEVERIEEDGKLVYERSICAVHRARMETKRVHFIFGLPASEAAERAGEPSIATVQQLFPNYRDFAYGGCEFEPDVQATLYVCAQCREAYREWKTQRDRR